jgi:hypothetical protein
MNPPFDPAQLPLRDIHLPGEIPWWPPALGWWFLAAALLGLCIALGAYIWRHRRHRAARRALDAIVRALATGAQPADCAQQASIVLRRSAMTLGGRSSEVAGLVGDRWLAYLNSHIEQPVFSDATGHLLLDVPYQAPERITAEQVRALCRACVVWVNAQPARA